MPTVSKHQSVHSASLHAACLAHCCSADLSGGEDTEAPVKAPELSFLCEMQSYKVTK